MILFAALLLSGCGSTRIIVARSSKLPVEAGSFLRVLQEEPVTVGVTGKDVVVDRDIAGYVVMHEQDAAQFVRNTAELQRLKSPNDNE